MNMHSSDPTGHRDPASPGSVEPSAHQVLEEFLQPSPTILVCLTLYNETADALSQTLQGLAKNQMFLRRMNHRSSSGEGPSLTVCIMLDGADRVAPCSAALLGRLGLALGGAVALKDGSGQTLSVSPVSLSANEIIARCGGQAMPWDGPHVRLLLCTKSINRGKLDSHGWFFKAMAPVAMPDFIVQIDAGSIPDDRCFAELLSHMALHTNCGAAATHILTSSETGGEMIVDWQHNDFLWSKATDWPIGHALGYMEVVPGQCCMVRWSALCRPAASAGDGATVLDAYLDGAKKDGLLARNLYLAEDRVLGLAVVEASGVAIEYVPSAKVQTDPCTDLDELLRQRRRWINSSFAARMVAVARVPAILTSPVLTLPRKASLVSAIVIGVYQMLLQIGLPALIVLFFTHAARTIATVIDPTVEAAWIEPAVSAVCLVLWTGLLIAMRQGLMRDCLFRKGRGLALYMLLAIMIAGDGILVVTVPVAFLSVAVTALAVTLAVLSLQRSSVGYWHRWMPLQLLIGPTINLYLTSYAFANIGDVSWGTKGLNKADASSRQQRRWRLIADSLLVGWIVATAAFLALLLSLEPATMAAILMVLFVVYSLPTISACVLTLARMVPALRLRLRPAPREEFA